MDIEDSYCFKATHYHTLIEKGCWHFSGVACLPEINEIQHFTRLVIKVHLELINIKHYRALSQDSYGFHKDLWN